MKGKFLSLWNKGKCHGGQFVYTMILPLIAIYIYIKLCFKRDNSIYKTLFRIHIDN